MDVCNYTGEACVCEWFGRCITMFCGYMDHVIVCRSFMYSGRGDARIDVFSISLWKGRVKVIPA